MKKTIGEILFLLGRAIIAVANRFRLSESNKSWVRDRGSETLRLDYDELTPESVVFDLGGYRGQWASDIFAKYRCAIYIFEPIPYYADFIERRFKKNDRIHLCRYGLANRSETIPISVREDASSIFGKAKGLEVKIVDIVTCLEDLKIGEIDLMKINIEGAEYDLLERLIEKDLIRRFKNIQIQFHDFVENSEARMKAIQKRLAETHSVTYEYRFIFENWKRR